MSMWVMAASPLLTSVDVRNMTAEIKSILTNPELLQIHKDPLARMATRIDVGHGWGAGTGNELHVANICSENFPQCQEGPGDPGRYCLKRIRIIRIRFHIFPIPLSPSAPVVPMLPTTLTQFGLQTVSWPFDRLSRAAVPGVLRQLERVREATPRQ
jgi:hypothetical protein